MTSSAADDLDMTFFELGPGQEFITQAVLDSGGCTLFDIVIAPPGKQDEALKHWTRHADYIKSKPGLLGAQLHRTPGDGTVLINLAVWESLAALHAVVSTPEFGDHSRLPARHHLHSAVAEQGGRGGGRAALSAVMQFPTICMISVT